MKLPAIITTRRLTLRPFELRDLDGYVAYYTGPRTAGVGGPKPVYQVAERFLAMAGQWVLRGFGRYAITDGGAAFGHVGVMQVLDTDPPEMTWTLWDASREGQGYATEAARAVMDAWAQTGGVPLIARIDRDNTASLRMVERLGLKEDIAAQAPEFLPNARTFLSARA